MSRHVQLESERKLPGVTPGVRRHPLIARVSKNLALRCGVTLDGDPPAKITLAVSGGADSVAMLLCFAAVRSQKDVAIAPAVVSINHGLRPEAVDEVRFVENLAGRFGMDFERVDLYLKDQPGNRQVVARDARYEALAAAAARSGSSFVATAHHADDQFETMLMNLCRRSTISAISGMPWSRPLAPGVKLIRPLLNLRRVECEDICRAAGIEWINDPSNVDRSQTRARLRQDVTPVLEELWPGAAARASDLSADLHEMLEWFDEEVAAALPNDQDVWDRDILRERPAAVLRSALRRAAVSRFGIEGERLSRRSVDDVVRAIRDHEQRPRSFDWPRNLRVLVTSKQVKMSIIPEHPDSRPEEPLPS